MTIYFILLFIVLFSSHKAAKSKDSGESRFFLWIAFVSMVLVAALRSRTVGTDTGSYVRYFEEIQTFYDVIEFGGQTWEYGYWFLSWLVHLFSDMYISLFFAVALIVVGCYQWAIIKYSSNRTISFFVFITMGFYTFFLNGTRQGIAMAICALAIGPLLERNFPKYLGCVLLATLFHKTAIILLPMYLIFMSKNSIKTYLLHGFIGITGSLTLQKIVSVGVGIDERYQDYAIVGEGGGYIMVGFICVLTVFFMAFKNKVIIDRDRYYLFLNMLIFGSVISLISAVASVNPSGILRLALYFNVSVIFLWPIVFNNLTTRSSRILFSYFICTGYLILFALTTTRFSNLVPYSFNPSLPFM